MKSDLNSKFIQSYINRKQVWWNKVAKRIKSKYDEIEYAGNIGRKRIKMSDDVNTQNIMKNTSRQYI